MLLDVTVYLVSHDNAVILAYVLRNFPDFANVFGFFRNFPEFFGFSEILSIFRNFPEFSGILLLL